MNLNTQNSWENDTTGLEKTVVTDQSQLRLCNVILSVVKPI